MSIEDLFDEDTIENDTIDEIMAGIYANRCREEGVPLFGSPKMIEEFERIMKIRNKMTSIQVSDIEIHV